MTFYLLDKSRQNKRTVDFKTFWDFYDEKDEHISGIKFVQWIDAKNLTYTWDLDRDVVTYTSLEKPGRQKIWTTYNAFKIPVTDYDEDACF